MKVSSVLLFIGLGLLGLDLVAYLITSIIGKVVHENGNDIEGKDFALLLIPIFVGLLFYFIKTIWDRGAKMNRYCGLTPLAHLIGDLAKVTMNVLVVLGICFSLIEGEVYTGYNFDTVVLIYGLFSFARWIRTAVGAIYEFGINDWHIVRGTDIRPEDKKLAKKFEASSTLLFKKKENGMSVNKMNLTQLFDLSELFKAVICFAIWKDFDDLEAMQGDLHRTFIAVMVYASLYFVMHLIIYLYFKMQIKGTDMGIMNFMFTMMLFMFPMKQFVLGVGIRLLEAVANYLENYISSNSDSQNSLESYSSLFDWSIAFSVMLIVLYTLWTTFIVKILTIAHDMKKAVGV